MRTCGMATLTIAVAAAAAGCSTHKNTLAIVRDRPATVTPYQFVLADGSLNPGTACLSPILDPRDQSSLTLVRSDRGIGDYRVAEGKYGVGSQELLRVDCLTGRAIGVIRQ